MGYRAEKLLTRDRQFYRTFLRLCTALMLEQAVVLSVNLADNLMLGNYSEAALSGVAAVNQIQFVYQQIVYGIGNAVIVLGSQYWGQRRLKEVRAVSGIGIWVELIVASLLFAAASLFPGALVRLFTEQEAFIEQGVSYLKIMRFSYPVFALSALLLNAMRIVEVVRIALYVSFLSLGINVSINYLLIAGHFGFPEMGARGAAVGTLTARIVELIVVTAFVLRDKRLGLRIRDLSLRVLKSRMFFDFMKVLLPILQASILWGMANALQTVILGHMNDSAIAAQSISNTVFLLLKVTAVGAASASSVIIGKAVGEAYMSSYAARTAPSSPAAGGGTADKASSRAAFDVRTSKEKGWLKLREYTRTLQVIFIGIGVVLALLMIFVRIPLLNIYARKISEPTLELANAYMLIQAAVLLFMSYQMPVNAGIIRGGGDVKFVMYLDTVAICTCIPLAYLAAFIWNWSAVCVILCMNADQFLKCIPAVLRVRSYRWVKTLTHNERKEL